MKRIRTLLMCLSALTLSCAKELAPKDTTLPIGEEPMVEIEFQADYELSAAALIPSLESVQENKVNRWCVFVFDTDGPWYAYATSGSSLKIPMNLRAGRTYRCYAVVNYPTAGTCAFNPAHVKKIADLTEKVSALSDNGTTSLVMFGSYTLIATATTLKVSIPVTRLVSRVDVCKVAVDFSGKPSLQDKPFILKHIYLTNVYRTSRYGSDYSYADLSATRSAWYNTMGWHQGESANSGMDLLLQKRDLNVTLSASQPYSTKQSLYAYPNPTPVSLDNRDILQWTKRNTRVVLETTLDGETLYYILSVPAMTRNRIYSSSDIVIKGKGSKDPEKPDYDPDTVEYSFTVSSDEWESPVTITENS